MEVFVVEIGMGVDLHGQDLTTAATRACRSAIERNSLPGISRVLPEGDRNNMKVRVTLGVPEVKGARQALDLEAVKRVFPYGTVEVRVVTGGLVIGSGVVLPDKNDQTDEVVCVVAAVEVGA